MLLGTDLPRLHAIVPAAGLPPAFGGTNAEPQLAWLDRLEAEVAKAGGKLGGFQLPLRVDDPTGAARAAAAAAGSELPTAAATSGSELPAAAVPAAVPAAAAAAVEPAGGDETPGSPDADSFAVE